jgi:hypothetical protein
LKDYQRAQIEKLIGELTQMATNGEDYGVSLFRLWETYVEEAATLEEKKQRMDEYGQGEYHGLFRWFEQEGFVHATDNMENLPDDEERGS